MEMLEVLGPNSSYFGSSHYILQICLITLIVHKLLTEALKCVRTVIMHKKFHSVISDPSAAHLKCICQIWKVWFWYWNKWFLSLPACAHYLMALCRSSHERGSDHRRQPEDLGLRWERWSGEDASFSSATLICFNFNQWQPDMVQNHSMRNRACGGIHLMIMHKLLWEIGDCVIDEILFEMQR